MEVANVVASIISAYGNGKDLFRRMLGKKSKRRGREATLSEQEAWLRDSLDRRPQQIRESYNSNLARFGHRFETGDSTAHSSLAHTLLMLNSGLIALINHVLHRDAKYDPATSRTLYDLSEAAASGTMAALSQLSLRLANQSALTLKSLPVLDAEKRPVKRSQKSRPGPTTVVRGAWVRPKTSSVVSIASSSSGRKKPSHERSKSEPSLPTTKKSTSKSRTRTPSPTRKEVASADQPRRRKHHSSQRRDPSMLLVPSDMFFPIHETSADHQAAPPRPPKIPLHSRPNPSRQPRPPSAATFMTTSTKIGEISGPHAAYAMPTPLEQQAYNPQLVQYIGEHAVPMEEKPRKIKRGFKFWKKAETPIAVPAC
jgi:hypothetical protein